MWGAGTTPRAGQVAPTHPKGLITAEVESLLRVSRFLAVTIVVLAASQ